MWLNVQLRDAGGAARLLHSARLQALDLRASHHRGAQLTGEKQVRRRRRVRDDLEDDRLRQPLLGRRGAARAPVVAVAERQREVVVRDRLGERVRAGAARAARKRAAIRQALAADDLHEPHRLEHERRRRAEANRHCACGVIRLDRVVKRTEGRILDLGALEEVEVLRDHRRGDGAAVGARRAVADRERRDGRGDRPLRRQVRDDLVARVRHDERVVQERVQLRGRQRRVGRRVERAGITWDRDVEGAALHDRAGAGDGVASGCGARRVARAPATGGQPEGKGHCTGQTYHSA